MCVCVCVCVCVCAQDYSKVAFIDRWFLNKGCYALHCSINLILVFIDRRSRKAEVVSHTLFTASNVSLVITL